MTFKSKKVRNLYHWYERLPARFFNALVIVLLFIILIGVNVNIQQANAAAFMPISVNRGDIFTYDVIEDIIFNSVNGTVYHNETYLEIPTDSIQIKVLDVVDVSEDDALLGSATLVNQSEINPKTSDGRDTFSYVNGWLAPYHYGLMTLIFVHGMMKTAPDNYKFQRVDLGFQEEQAGLPIFTTNNASYYERLMTKYPPTEEGTNSTSFMGIDVPPYSLTYTYDKENGIYAINHTMGYQKNGTLLDNLTNWSVDLKMEFFMNTTFTRSIVNDMKLHIFWTVQASEASQVFEWSLHVVLKQEISSRSSSVSITSNNTTPLPNIINITVVLILFSLLTKKFVIKKTKKINK